MTAAWAQIVREVAEPLSLTPGADRVATRGSGWLSSALPVSDLATGSIATVAAALADLSADLGLAAREVVVDRRLADVWCGSQAEPVDGVRDAAWDPLSRAFPTADRSWIRLHANASHHRDRLLDVLGCGPDAVAPEIAHRDAVELESALVEAGGAAAALRTPAEWASHPAGAAVATEPLIRRSDAPDWDGRTGWAPTPARPLTGLRVLDLTRVIAGPVCTQVLAGLGAEVLRIDPPGWDEPAVLPGVMWGKRSARLDARTPAGASRLRDLLAEADVLVHGYRAGALERLGLSVQERHRIRPGLVDVSERAYGFSGPWHDRRGFDSLVQFATGIARAPTLGSGGTRPVSLPVQALDYATGYLAAAAALAGLTRRTRSARGSVWGLSLARTALALQTLPPTGIEPTAGPPDPSRVPRRLRETTTGPVALADSPLRIGEAGLDYAHLAVPLGTDPARWT